MDRLSKVSIREKFATFSDLWSPKTVALVDDFAIKLVRSMASLCGIITPKQTKCFWQSPAAST